MYTIRNTQNIHEPYMLPTVHNYKYKLDLNEMTFPLPKGLNDIIKSTYTLENLCRYPTCDEVNSELLKLIAEHTCTDSNNIALTCGSDNALKLICSVILSKCRNILIITPTYPQFALTVSYFTKCNIDYVNIEHKDSMEVILSKINDRLKHCHYDACYIVTPNMPLGYSIPVRDIENLLTLFNDTLFIIDHAYVEYSKHKCDSLIYTHDNIVITRTFSKFFALSSLRIGYVIAPTKTIQLLMAGNTTKDVTQIAINSATFALQNVQHYDNILEECRKIKDYVDVRMKDIIKNNNFFTDFCVGDGPYFIIFSKDSAFLTEYMRKHNIYIRNKHSDIPNSVRISFAPYDTIVDVLNIAQHCSLDD